MPAALVERGQAQALEVVAAAQRGGRGRQVARARLGAQLLQRARVLALQRHQVDVLLAQRRHRQEQDVSAGK